MPLNKQSGNMYPDITHTQNPVSGECEHGCIYCTTKGNKKPVIQKKYSGKPKLVEHELKVNLGDWKFIFVENMADLFAENVDTEIILKVLAYYNKYPLNRYMFQSKNPDRFIPFLETGKFPPNTVLDTTVETNSYPQKTISKAPPPIRRTYAMTVIKKDFPLIPRRITVEPIMPFNLRTLYDMIVEVEPEQVYIGANSNLICRDCLKEYRYRNMSSKACPRCDSLDITNSDGHPEPRYTEVLALIKGLQSHGIKIIKKANLARLN